MKRQFLLCSLLALSAFMGGCASMSSDMEASKETTAAPAQGKALVVFFRDSFFGGGIQSELFEMNGPDKEPTFLGFVSSGTKVAYQAEPGDHMFMIESEAADFAAAHLVAGKTYYVMVEPRMGVWKARFSLEPIHKAPGKYSLQSPDFPKWMSDTKFVEQKPSAMDWYNDNKDDVLTKQKKYWNDWVTDDQGSRDDHTLAADDGN